MQSFILEICVDSVESAVAAERGGATRLELCQNLMIGGTTPGIKLFEAVREEIHIPIHILIRPRFGDFCYTDYEWRIMKEEIRMFRDRKSTWDRYWDVEAGRNTGPGPDGSASGRAGRHVSDPSPSL